MASAGHSTSLSLSVSWATWGHNYCPSCPLAQKIPRYLCPRPAPRSKSVPSQTSRSLCWGPWGPLSWTVLLQCSHSPPPCPTALVGEPVSWGSVLGTSARTPTPLGFQWCRQNRGGGGGGFLQEGTPLPTPGTSSPFLHEEQLRSPGFWVPPHDSPGAINTQYNCPATVRGCVTPAPARCPCPLLRPHPPQVSCRH